MRNTGNGGSGLGLAISHLLVEAMQGRIGYKNRTRGTNIWFEIPIAACLSPRPACLDLQSEPLTAPENALHCLLVDDDPIGVIVTTRQLERLGLTVTWVATVAEAREAVRQKRHDIFVVDYLLPDGNGPTLVRELRSEIDHPARFLALTANVESLQDSASGQASFDCILAKPVGTLALSSAIFGTGSGLLPWAKPLERLTAPDLEGLSPRTIAAMIDTFESTWAGFRKEIREWERLPSRASLADTAHRLAGTCAILGVSEIEPPLRELEFRCRARGSAADIAPLVPVLDRDLSKLSSWDRIRSMRTAP